MFGRRHSFPSLFHVQRRNYCNYLSRLSIITGSSISQNGLYRVIAVRSLWSYKFIKHYFLYHHSKILFSQQKIITPCGSQGRVLPGLFCHRPSSWRISLKDNSTSEHGIGNCTCRSPLCSWCIDESTWLNRSSVADDTFPLPAKNYLL